MFTFYISLPRKLLPGRRFSFSAHPPPCCRSPASRRSYSRWYRPFCITAEAPAGTPGAWDSNTLCFYRHKQSVTPGGLLCPGVTLRFFRQQKNRNETFLRPIPGFYQNRCCPRPSADGRPDYSRFFPRPLCPSSEGDAAGASISDFVCERPSSRNKGPPDRSNPVLSDIGCLLAAERSLSQAPSIKTGTRTGDICRHIMRAVDTPASCPHDPTRTGKASRMEKA